MRKWLDDLLVCCRRWDSDKWIHIVLFLFLTWLASTAAWAALLAAGCRAPRPLTGLIGVAVSSAAALWKEFYDKRTEQIFDGEDLAAGFIGIALFYVVYSV